MTKRKSLMIFSLIIPVVVLMSFAVRHHLRKGSGTEITLPIYGYDPRDFLSGHYLTYIIDYGVKIPCESQKNHSTWYVCLDTKTTSLDKPKGCAKLIKGVCKGGRFVAGTERFYIPETKAAFLDKKTQSGAAHLVMSVDEDGNALAKDLLIDGVSWKNTK
ncbi:MAG: GDYXXLXY domain-containing protein [Alphaproteobacteria bacterium]|nr:GDYXXLXY domain-containing protein [Alphaproteobacteria bacterium]